MIRTERLTASLEVLRDEPLSGLPNLGPKSAQMLALVGITTTAQLRQLGSVAAYARVKQSGANASLNLLWALEGALTGLPWQVVARDHRTSLLLALEAHQRGTSPSKPATPGYSGTPLAKKLGVKDGSQVLVVGAPEGYAKLLEPLPEAVQFVSRLSETTDIVHLFTDRRAELQRSLTAFRNKLKPTAMVWVSWPKKSAKVPTDITEDTVREVALPLGFVDIKVCAVTDVWSGLKLVVRKELR